MFPRLLVFVLATVTAALPLASGEHVHELEDHGHIEFVVHRHLQAHGVVQTHHSPYTVDHEDAPVAIVNQDYTVPASITLTAPASLATVVLPEPPAYTRRVDAGFVERSIHGPPRAPTGLRAPPARLS